MSLRPFAGIRRRADRGSATGFRAAPPLLHTPTNPVAAGAETTLSAQSRVAGACRADHAAQAPSIPRPPTKRPVLTPLSPDRYKVQMTVSGDTVETLRRVQQLMRHTVPDGDPAVIVGRALTLLLEHLERQRLAATRRPRARTVKRTRSRHIPAAVRRAVWARDEGRCTFVGHEGRCGERAFLQFHHLEPYALGGEATVEGIALRCRAHNLYEAELEFGIRPPDVARETRLPYGASCDDVVQARTATP